MRLDWLREASWLDRQRISDYSKIFAFLLVLVTAGWMASGEGLVGRDGKPLGTDFLSFWSASSLALAGAPAEAYDPDLHRAAQIGAIEQPDIPYYGWFYPPMFLALALPLALLPYGWSLAAWLGVTFAGYFGVLRRIAPGRDAAWLAAAFPAVFVNIGHGQNGFLSAALLGGAMLTLERRPALAGALIGLLTYKPQLGLLLPLVLLAGGHWRAFAAAAATAVAFGLVTLGAFGIETWQAFLAATADAGQVMATGAVGWHKLQSSFAAIRLLGGGETLAYAVHAAVAIAGAAAALWVWRCPVALPLKGAALVAATLLATPWLLDYDLMLLALAIAWLGRTGVRDGFLPWEKSALAGAWLLPLVARPLADSLSLPLTPPVVGALLILIVRRVAATRPAGAPGADWDSRKRFVATAEHIAGRYVPVRFVMFGMIGAVGMFVHFAILAAAHHLADFAFFHAQAVAAAGAMTFNYLLNNRLTFGDRPLRGRRLLKGLLSFYLVCGIGALANVHIADFLFGQGASWLVAGFAGAVIGSVWNYAMNAGVTWSDKSVRRDDLPIGAVGQLRVDTRG